MAAEEAFNINDSNALAALLFLAALTNAVDVFSAVNSSPWTAESFGGDKAKADSVREYVKHAIIITAGMAVVTSLIAKSWWPLVGMAAADGYMYFLYDRALKRATASQSKGWDNGRVGTPAYSPGYQ